MDLDSAIFCVKSFLSKKVSDQEAFEIDKLL